MGINIKISGSEIGGDTNILNGSRLTKDSRVDISVEGSNLGDDFNVGNDSKDPNINLHMEDTSVNGSVNVAQGATNPRVNATFRNVTAPKINIPGTPTEDTTHRETGSYDTGFTYRTYSDAYKKATSHPEKTTRTYSFFGAILNLFAEMLDPNRDSDRDK